MKDENQQLNIALLVKTMRENMPAHIEAVELEAIINWRMAVAANIGNAK